jgi:hypothetical protein
MNEGFFVQGDSKKVPKLIARVHAKLKAIISNETRVITRRNLIAIPFLKFVPFADLKSGRRFTTGGEG